MVDLQDAINTPIFVDIALPIEERRHQTRAVARLKMAARRLANPDYERAYAILYAHENPQTKNQVARLKDVAKWMVDKALDVTDE